VAAGGAVVVAIAAGGFMVLRGRGGVPAEPASASTAAPVGSASTSPAPSRSVPATAAAVAPREVAAPPVAAGRNSTLDEARSLAVAVAEPGEILTTEDTRF